MKKARNTKKESVISELYQDTKKVKKLDRKTPKRSILMIAMGVLLSGIIGLSWWYILKNQSFNDSGIVVSIDKEPLSSGVTSDIAINYKNNTGKTLSNAKVRVKVPHNVVITNTNPSSDEPATSNGTLPHNLTFTLGTLAEDASGKILVSAALFAQQDTAHSFDVFFEYRPANFNANFEKKIATTLRTEKIPYTLTVTTPEKIEAAKEFSGSTTVTFQEISAHERALKFAPSFTITTSTPPFLNNELKLTNTTTPQTITFSGIYQNQTKEGDYESEIQIIARLPNQNIIESTQKIKQTVTEPKLIFITTLGQNKPDAIFTKDESIPLESVITNNDAAAQKNVSFEIDIAVPFKDSASTLRIDTPCTIKQPKSTNPIKKVTISCTAKQIADLKELAPAQTIRISHTISPLKESITNAPLLITPHLLTPTTQHSEVITVTLRNDATFITKITHNNEILRTFAKDGITEVVKRRYVVTGTLTPKGELADVEMRMPLGAHIEMEPLTSPSIGELQYIAATHTLLYTANTLNTEVPEIPISFSFYTVTSLGDVENKSVSDDVMLQAADTLSKSYFSKKLSPIVIP